MLCAAGGDAIQQHTFEKVLRVIIDGKVYFSEEYKRMSKRVSYAVLFQTSGDMEFGFVKYFVHDKESGETFAVIDVPNTTDAPVTLKKFALHHVWLSSER